MSKIAIYDVDSAIPNLALMKISAYHKSIGDSVYMYLPLMAAQYDKIYASKVFGFSDGSSLMPDNMDIGGTGWDLQKMLPDEIEAMSPDYSLYKYEHSIGFTMRGCRFNCSFCVVPKKEGRPKPYNTIEEIWTNRNSNFVTLLDNDFFGNPQWNERLDEIRDNDLRVNFNQAINVRVLTDEQARALRSIKFVNKNNNSRQIACAWDRLKDESLVFSGLDRCVKAGIRPRQIMVYVLIGYDTTPDQDHYRVMKLREYGCDPYVMQFDEKNRYQSMFRRWVNKKEIFFSCSWESYLNG